MHSVLCAFGFQSISASRNDRNCDWTVGFVGGRIWDSVCRTAGVRSRRKDWGDIDVKSWLGCVALSVAMRYMTVLREETRSSGPNGPYEILAGNERPPCS